MATQKHTKANHAKGKSPTSPWGSSLDKLEEWDPKRATLLLRVGTNPWTSRVLPLKEVELISLALHCSCTTLDEVGTRHHIRGSLDAGATRDEILLAIQCAFALAVHSCGATPEEIMAALQICVSMGIQACAMGVPILAEELKRSEK